MSAMSMVSKWVCLSGEGLAAEKAFREVLRTAA